MKRLKTSQERMYRYNVKERGRLNWCAIVPRAEKECSVRPGPFGRHIDGRRHDSLSPKVPLHQLVGILLIGRRRIGLPPLPVYVLPRQRRVHCQFPSHPSQADPTAADSKRPPRLFPSARDNRHRHRSQRCCGERDAWDVVQRNLRNLFLWRRW